MCCNTTYQSVLGRRNPAECHGSRSLWKHTETPSLVFQGTIAVYCVWVWAVKQAAHPADVRWHSRGLHYKAVWHTLGIFPLRSFIYLSSILVTSKCIKWPFSTMRCFFHIKQMQKEVRRPPQRVSRKIIGQCKVYKTHSDTLSAFFSVEITDVLFSRLVTFTHQFPFSQKMLRMSLRLIDRKKKEQPLLKVNCLSLKATYALWCMTLCVQVILQNPLWLFGSLVGSSVHF